MATPYRSRTDHIKAAVDAKLDAAAAAVNLGKGQVHITARPKGEGFDVEVEVRV